ncbi:hypothetical protein ACNSZF_32305 [Burkholderia gladioli]
MAKEVEAKSTKGPAGPILPVLPAMGLSKWAQIAPFIPCCRETWRKLVLAGKAPRRSACPTTARSTKTRKFIGISRILSAIGRKRRERPQISKCFRNHAE